jgi:hypothetical protein
MLCDQIIQHHRQRPIDSIRSHDEWRNRSRHILLRHIHPNMPRVRRGMTGRNHHLCWIVGVRRAEGARFPRNARIDLAVRRTHGELVQRPLRHAWLLIHVRRARMGRPNDEVTIRSRRWNRTVGKLFSGDVSSRMRIASRRRRTRRGWLHLCQGNRPGKENRQGPDGHCPHLRNRKKSHISPRWRVMPSLRAGTRQPVNYSICRAAQQNAVPNDSDRELSRRRLAPQRPLHPSPSPPPGPQHPRPPGLDHRSCDRTLP